MRDHIVLYINGQRYSVSGDEAFLTLTEYLRRIQRMVGTKVVCAEGDCGACSVLLGRPDAADETIVYQAVDACILFVFQLDSLHVVTIEGLVGKNLATAHEALTPIQDAMVNCHGSQCGFCTPGMVIAMHSIVESDQPLNEDSLRYGLSGNLCRCTGYQQIIDAGLSVNGSVGKIESIHPSDSIMKALRRLSRDEVKLIATAGGASRSIYLPTKLEQACQWKSSNPMGTIVGGATDLGVQYSHGRFQPHDCMALAKIANAGFSDIAADDDRLTIGGGASWLAIEQVTETFFPAYHQIIMRFGSPQIRSQGTLGGNLATGSSIADSIPFHLVMDAEIELTSVRGIRHVLVNDFYTDYRQSVMADDEIISAVSTPLLKPHQKLALYKVSRRRDMDISTLTMAVLIDAKSADTIDAARIAIGGVGPIVMRMTAVEEYLVGQRPSAETFARAGRIARDQISPWSDVRGSTDFRLQLAENLCSKAYHELYEELVNY